jgi:hypothetical protein
MKYQRRKTQRFSRAEAVQLRARNSLEWQHSEPMAPKSGWKFERSLHMLVTNIVIPTYCLKTHIRKAHWEPPEGFALLRKPEFPNLIKSQF